jgi:hypothetical protein
MSCLIIFFRNFLGEYYIIMQNFFMGNL